LLNVYNSCIDWREIHAEKDLKGFLLAATLAMLTGYQTSGDVLKQVSHRGAIRMPAYMVKGKCRRYLLSQFTVQRETRCVERDDGTRTIRWFYRLLWDGGNVAYNDYMKTVLTKEEVESILPPTASAEYIGDIFEFWLGMLELGIQFPTMFEGWGANIDSCLPGLEESFWLFCNSCRHADTINTERNRSRKAYIPPVENAMVTAILKEAKVFDLLLQSEITRMPVIPTANYDDNPEMIQISSSEGEEEDEVEEPEEDPSSPPARGSRMEQASGETDAGGDDIEVDDDEEDMGGRPSEAKKRRTEVRSIRDQFEKMVAEASNVRYCLVCGGDHNLDECPAQDSEPMIDAIMRMRLMMEQQSKSPSSSEKSRAATRGRKDKLPKKGIMPEGKRWRRTRFTEKEEVTKSFYSQPAYMYEIGDREEGGSFLVNGIEVHPPGQGVRNRQELDALVERAAEESPPVLPSIQELNSINPKSSDEFQKWMKAQRDEHGSSWNFRYLQPYTYGNDIGTLQMARLSGEEYVGHGWCDVRTFAENEWMGRKWETPQWMIDLSKRFNAALRHSVGCVRDKKGHTGIPCDEAGWVNVEQIMKYDHIWKDGHTLAGTSEPDYEIIVRRWDSFQKIIFTEYKQTKRIRAQILGLKVTKGALERTLRLNNAFTKRINRQKLRIEIGNDDREIWLWPVAVRAPMAHSRTLGGVQIDDSKTSYLMNPGVGYTLGGGFHCTTFECIAQIFREGLRPGGGGDRINTFFVPFAPWDDRSKSVLRFRKIDGADLVYIYMTYESLAKFSPRVSADGHILVQQTIPFNSFGAVWHYDWKSGEFYRLMITKGYEQLVLSVKGAKKIATIDRFDNLIENVVPDESSPDLNELRKLIDIKSAHQSYSCRLFPTHQDWNDAISLLALTHRRIARTRKVTDYAQLVYVRLHLCWQFVLSVKDT